MAYLLAILTLAAGLICFFAAIVVMLFTRHAGRALVLVLLGWFFVSLAKTCMSAM